MSNTSFAIILMGKREPVALLRLSAWCLLIVVWLFLAVTQVCVQFVIVVFPDRTIFIKHPWSSFIKTKVLKNKDCFCF